MKLSKGIIILVAGALIACGLALCLVGFGLSGFNLNHAAAEVAHVSSLLPSAFGVHGTIGIATGNR